MTQRFTDPGSGRQYEQLSDGSTRWLDGPPPPPPPGDPAPRPGNGAGASLESSPKKRHPVRNTILGIIGAVIVFGLLANCLGGGGGSTTTQPSGSSTASVAAGPAFSVTAASIGDEFDVNQPAAEKKYKGKLVTVTRAEISNLQTSYVLTKASSKDISITQIRCDLTNRDQALALKNGATVTLTGTVTGQSMGVIGLKGCSVR